MNLNVVDDDLRVLAFEGRASPHRWDDSTAQALQLTLGLLRCCHTHRDVRNLALLAYHPLAEDPDHGHINVEPDIRLWVHLNTTTSSPTIDVLSIEEPTGRN